MLSSPAALFLALLASATSTHALSTLPRPVFSSDDSESHRTHRNGWGSEGERALRHKHRAVTKWNGGWLNPVVSAGSSMESFHKESDKDDDDDDEDEDTMVIEKGEIDTVKATVVDTADKVKASAATPASKGALLSASSRAKPTAPKPASERFTKTDRPSLGSEPVIKPLAFSSTKPTSERSTKPNGPSLNTKPVVKAPASKGTPLPASSSAKPTAPKPTSEGPAKPNELSLNAKPVVTTPASKGTPLPASSSARPTTPKPASEGSAKPNGLSLNANPVVKTPAKPIKKPAALAKKMKPKKPASIRLRIKHRAHRIRVWGHKHKATIAGASAGLVAGVVTTIGAAGLGPVASGALGGAVGSIVDREVRDAIKRKQAGERIFRRPKSVRDFVKRTWKHIKLDAIPAVSGAIGGGVGGAVTAGMAKNMVTGFSTSVVTQSVGLTAGTAAGVTATIGLETGKILAKNALGRGVQATGAAAAGVAAGNVAGRVQDNLAKSKATTKDNEKGDKKAETKKNVVVNGAAANKSDAAATVVDKAGSKSKPANKPEPAGPRGPGHRSAKKVDNNGMPSSRRPVVNKKRPIAAADDKLVRRDRGDAQAPEKSIQADDDMPSSRPLVVNKKSSSVPAIGNQPSKAPIRATTTTVAQHNSTTNAAAANTTAPAASVAVPVKVSAPAPVAPVSMVGFNPNSIMVAGTPAGQSPSPLTVPATQASAAMPLAPAMPNFLPPMPQPFGFPMPLPMSMTPPPIGMPPSLTAFPSTFTPTVPGVMGVPGMMPMTNPMMMNPSMMNLATVYRPPGAFMPGTPSQHLAMPVHAHTTAGRKF